MDSLQNRKTTIQIEVEKSLSKKFGERVEIFDSNSIGGGCINNASKIKTNVGNFFLKWNANCQSDMFIREKESLNELKEAAGQHLHIPEVITAQTVDLTPGFLVLEFFHQKFSTSADEEKLGRGLAQIHKYSAKKFGFYSNNYCGATLQNNRWKDSWIEFYRDNRLRFLLNLIQIKYQLPVSEIKVYDKLLDRIPKLIPEKSEAVLIHGDLWSGNFMISEKGPVLIDPAAYYANREMELAIMTMFSGFSRRFYAAYNDVNPLHSSWKEQNGIYQIYHLLNHFYLFGGTYQKQALNIAKHYL